MPATNPANPLSDLLARVHERFRTHDAGEPAGYVEPTGGVDTRDFGLAITTVDGHTYSHGEADRLFAIQSISKAFTYAVALTDAGFEAVDAVIDVEPSGEAFNEISLQEGTGRPSNALINAGAIASTSLVSGSSSNPYAVHRGDGTDEAADAGAHRSPEGSRRERLVRAFSRMAGRELTINERVLEFEREDGDRNLALAHLMRSFDLISEGPEEIADDYFAACAIEVTTEDLSMMAALLATGGIHPVSGKRLLGEDVVERVLGVMSTCGMYDDAGEWMVRVGLPAKSGVGGGILAVVPGQAGVAVYSPPLDRHGNSERGVLACEALSQELDLHLMHGARVTHSAVRVTYPVTAAPSGVRRRPAAEAVLAEHGHRGRVIEVQGDLTFGAAESVMRELVGLQEVDGVVLDVRRVTEVTDFARAGLAELARGFEEQDIEMVLVDDSGRVADAEQVRVVSRRREAIEKVEELLLERHGGEDLDRSEVEVQDAGVLATLGAADTEALTQRMEAQEHAAGDVVITEGEPFAGIHLITSGTVETTAREPGLQSRDEEDPTDPGEDDDIEYRRLSVLGPGHSFGEFGLLADGRHAATVTAREHLHTWVLTPEVLRQLESEDPALALRLWQAISRDAYTRIRSQMDEIAARGADRR
ncbi:glutaminase [Kytococcus sedentarius]|uniref:glutaminase n=1 Tax=Kytococcus sedentarius TaxID=1276 RepID=UPI0035BC1B15